MTRDDVQWVGGGPSCVCDDDGLSEGYIGTIDDGRRRSEESTMSSHRMKEIKCGETKREG